MSYYPCPAGTFAYAIQPGDTFYSLANQYNVPLDGLLQANPYVDPNNLQIGQAICIPGYGQAVPYGYPYSGAAPGYFYAPWAWPQGSEALGDPPQGPPPQHQGPSQQRQGPPRSAPPRHVPNEPALRAIDPGAIRGCLYRFTYIWLQNRQSFWAYPVFVGRNSLAGWRFRRGRWEYFGMDLRDIRSFSC